jgi:hypothetical protein
MSDQGWQPPDEHASVASGERSPGGSWSPPQFSPDRRWWWTGDRWVPVPPQVAVRTNRWAVAALIAGAAPFFPPFIFGVVVGIADWRVGDRAFGLSDALQVTAISLPGLVLSAIGILVGRRRGGVRVRTAIAGGICALAFSAMTLLLMFG